LSDSGNKQAFYLNKKEKAANQAIEQLTHKHATLAMMLRQNRSKELRSTEQELICYK